MVNFVLLVFVPMSLGPGTQSLGLGRLSLDNKCGLQVVVTSNQFKNKPLWQYKSTHHSWKSRTYSKNGITNCEI